MAGSAPTPHSAWDVIHMHRGSCDMVLLKRFHTELVSSSFEADEVRRTRNVQLRASFVAHSLDACTRMLHSPPLYFEHSRVGQ